MLLEIKTLTVYYDSVLALDNVSLTVREGEIVAMIGPNGAGKSTALKAVCGLVTPQSGGVIFQGEKINGKQPFQLVRNGLCLVPEGRRVFTSMTVFENLEMGTYTRNDKKATKESMSKVFQLFPVLKERQKQRGGTLSSGEQQMLAILLVEQNARMALEYAHRGYVFSIGKIAFEDRAKNLLENDEVRKSFLGEI